ncbi:MAG: 3-hydroxyacyl-CoA dehydrogenase [Candidatus Dormibacteria bacterium]|jgi:3-hydroxybutyryl-CoA dehydrogenase|nr:3-hydroxyacyl-CoA dehydrogenase [Chloroflexota bacterium]
MRVEDVRRVLLIGSGTMGLQIGLQAATHGYEVVVYEIDSAAREAAPRRLRAYAEEQRTAGVLAAGELERSLARVTVTADPVAAGADSDVLIECVPEDPDLKGRVLAQFDGLCPPRTVFATNTSTLLPSMYAEASGRPDRLAALHFHIPVWSANVVDVMPHPGTSTETTELLVAFARRLGQIPIRMRRESIGYVFNAVYTAMNRAAITLVANDVASVEDVDRAWMAIMKTPFGPFGALDDVGIDTAWHITEYWAGVTGDVQLRTNADWLRGYVDSGRTGAKAGEGFYRYPNPAYAEPGFVEGT